MWARPGKEHWKWKRLYLRPHLRGKLKAYVLFRSRYPGPGQREEEGKRGRKIPDSNGEGPCNLGSASQMLRP